MSKASYAPSETKRFVHLFFILQHNKKRVKEQLNLTRNWDAVFVKFVNLLYNYGMI